MIEDEINGILKLSDGEIISKLKEDSSNDDMISFAWKTLKDYYEKCIDRLKNTTNLEYDDFGNGMEAHMCKHAKEYINNIDSNGKKDFLEYCCNFFNVSKEVLLEKVNNNDKDYIIKICRLYNMRLKLGHSARITYIARYELLKMFEARPDLDINDYSLLSNTIILASLMHDIGRFYQATKYNTLNDMDMREGHIKEQLHLSDNQNVDHAIAGYYYSVAEAIGFHKIAKSSSINDRKKFIQETITALVIRFHQRGNSEDDMKCFDHGGDASLLRDSDEFVDKMFDFIIDAYNNAKAMKYNVKFDEDHKEFIDKFLREKILKPVSDIGSDFTDVNDSNSKKIDRNALAEELKNAVDNYQDKTIGKMSDEILDIIEKYARGYEKEMRYSSTDRSLMKAEIELHLLNEMLVFDIATSINHLITIDDTMLIDKGIDEDLKLFMSKCMTVTTDADKLDILFQRATGKYPSKPIIDTIEIFAEEGKSLKDILNNYFKFDLPDSGMELNNDLIVVLNKLPLGIREVLENSLFKDIDDVFEPGTLNFRRGLMINDKNKKAFNELFYSDYIGLITNNCDLEFNLDNFQNSKYSNLSNRDEKRKLYISVPVDLIEKNLGDQSVEEKEEFYKKILLSDMMKKRIFFEKDNPIANGWICKADDAKHVVSSRITALLWQLNQFIFVNMRNLYSFKFLQENNILDDILEQCNESDTKIEYSVIKEYIDYAKSFIDIVIDYCEKRCIDSISDKDLKFIMKVSELVSKNNGMDNHDKLIDNKLDYIFSIIDMMPSKSGQDDNKDINVSRR